MTHRLIVVTGNNGVGKSSVARAVRERLGAALMRYPESFRRFREEAAIDEEVPPKARLAYYLAATLHLSELVSEELRSRPVVLDRYLESPVSLVASEAGLSDEAVDALVAPFTGQLVCPDLTVLLTCDYATARARIAARDGEQTRATRVRGLVLDSESFYLARERSLRRESARLGPLLELDTSTVPLDGVIDQVFAAAGL